MNRNTLATLGGLAIAGLFVYQVTAQGGKAPAMAADDVGPINRYQIVHTQDATDTTLWMIDTSTGRIWRRYIYPDGDHWTQTVREDYPSAYVKLDGMPPKPPAAK